MPTPHKTAAARKTRVFLVDDHPLLLRCMAESLDEEPDLVVCGQAGSAAEALAALADAAPDLVLVDLSLPGRDGLALIVDLKAHAPTLPILVFSMHDESRYAERALQAGAVGYVMKSAPVETLFLAIRKAMAGAKVTSRQTQRPRPHARKLCVSRAKNLVRKNN
jgi:DNA-binding NarL/FixJ family response regulator